jgi:hypothetical protein
MYRLASVEKRDQPITRVLDLEAVRLLAQPARLRIQEQLRQGPVNATTLARAMGWNTGLASYHLRELAKHGFVEEVPELARGRERWWRSARMDRRLPPREEQGPEMRALLDQMVRLDLATDLEGFATAQLKLDNAAGEAWVEQLPYSRGFIEVTADELTELYAEYLNLLSRYRRPPGEIPPDARPVVASFLAYPTSAPPATDIDTATSEQPGDAAEQG